MTDKDKDQLPKLESQSGVNQKGEAFVQLIYAGKIILQMDPWQARDFGTGLVMTAEAAEQDAFMFDWVIKHVGVGPDQAVGLLQDFRKYREETTFKRGGPANMKDWVLPEWDGPPDVGKKGKKS